MDKVRSSVSANAHEDFASSHIASTPAEDFRTIALNRISWGAILTGVVMAFSVQIILNLIGVGIGAATMASTDASSVAAEVSVGVFIWWAISGVISSLIGGYAAGRASGEPKRSTAAWHGLTSWAASVLLIAVMITTAAGSVISDNFRLMADVSTSYPAASIAERSSVGDRYILGNEGIYGPIVNQNDIVTSAETTAEMATGGVAGGALFSALALLLGGIAAWVGGWMGIVNPVLTDRTLRRENSIH